MVTYKKEEIMTATQIVRNFSSALNDITNGDLEKLVIVKNNRFEAVMIPLEKYEKMSEALEILGNIYKKTKMSPDGE